ncbi:hypothetical protein B0T18DRAFT_415264 [Schizothecium vesticola]|uniref:BZIP domain-containing protein n=1 Tax=Schizothecium vesticola TaxID=314040 RepID=A0AA40K2H0_9PEZI|nr:hypothetical protein B0T18DRAFT_415264 [Schizothecium vesticola]
MPSKIKNPASAVQNRNNQRLARARRKELIEDLQRRLQEYERRGVEASREMQQAARLVTLENQRLRLLLAARGVSQHEITAHLSAPDTLRDGSEARPDIKPPAWHRPRSATRYTAGAMKAAGGPRAWPMPSPVHHHHPSPPTTAASSPSPDSMSLGHASPGPASSVSEASDHAMMEARWESRHEEPSQGSLGQVHAPHLFHDMQGQDASGILPPVYDCYCPPLSPASVTNSTWPLEMSCLEAASILAGISRDADLACDLLGCVGTEDCMVSSARVFQLMVELE